MIIEALLNVVYAILSLLTAPINIPSLPEGVQTFIQEAIQYIRMGIALLANWTDLDYLLVLFGLVVAVDVGLLVYKAVMWFLRKIPMLGIK